jgi:hypothetical protein
MQVRVMEELRSRETFPWIAERTGTSDGSTPPSTQDQEALKARLIDCYVKFSMSKELSEWLQDLGLPATGTMQEKLARLRQQAERLVLPAESVSRQTIWYLHQYDENVLVEICQQLGIDNSGTKDDLLTRIYRVVGTSEGWLQLQSEEARQLIMGTFLPIMSAIDPKHDYDLDLWNDLGAFLTKQDTHRPRTHGHGSAFMAVLIPGFLQEARGALLQDELNDRAAGSGLTAGPKASGL